MNKSKRNRIRTGEPLEPRLVLDSTVVFNEVMFHPTDAAEQLEFVELHNQMAVDVDISDWHIADGVSFEFPVGTIIPGGGYLVVARNPEALKNAAGVDAMGPFAGRLSNRGEILELRDRNERLLDILEYSDRGKWDDAADGLGPSLAKVDKDSFTNRAENWSQSFIVGGTPGNPNFEDGSSESEDTVRSLVADESAWSYWDAGNEPTGWKTSGFSDANWQSGIGPFYAGSARADGAELEVIAGAQATASSFLPGHEPEHAVNGNGLIGDAHVTEPSVRTMWVSAGTLFVDVPDTDPEITFDLGVEKTIDAMKVWNLNNVDSAICCLQRGIAVADIMTAGEDGVFTTFIENQTLSIAPGTETDFSQVIAFGGHVARYVKIDVDTTNGIANHGDQFGFVGLSEVQFLSAPPAGNTEVAVGPTTHYFRKQFNFEDAPNRTTLELDMLLDDGAIVYLNGTEIFRHNMPNGAANEDTLALFPLTSAVRTAKVEVPGDLLVRGENTLAVEVHQAAIDDPDMVFAMSLSATTRPPDPFVPESISLKINEVPAGHVNAFFVELTNIGPNAIDISGNVVTAGDVRTTIPNGTQIAPGQLYVVPNLDSIENNVVLVVENQDGSLVLDAVRVRDKGIGLSNGVIAFTETATPGQPNAFSFTDDVVINEIMYNFRPTVAIPATPPKLSLNSVVDLGSTWRYNDKGDDLPSNWYLTSHSTGEANWSEGPGLLGVETSSLPGPGLQTQTDPPSANEIITLYFETNFELTAEQIASFDGYQMRHVIDDGAVIYINNQEVVRFNLPDGDIDSETRTTASVSNADLSDAITLSPDLFVVGSNRISAEVHQRSPTSNDLVFGLELAGGSIIAPGIPATSYQDNDEEWIELYNRSSQPIDLGGWSLDDAVSFEFPAGRMIQPGEYLIVARDAGELLTKYPDLASQIAGEYQGSLANKTDRIVLYDANDNAADVVEYFQDGRWPEAADGRGSSLELRDPTADNSLGLAWQASDEVRNSPWQEYSYSGFTKPSAVGPDTQWRELVLGLLADGTILLDDIQVIKDPNGEAVNVLQNGTFEGDVLGQHPDKWRLIGNHRNSEVVSDPDDPNNKVLKFVATGATEHMHNHAETTLFENGETHRINNGVEYEIRYRARWVKGSNQLNSRLYFNRLARTTPIARQTEHGTPGRENSIGMENIGPTFDGLIHSPAVPDRNQSVTVSVNASDPDGVQQLTLWYRVGQAAWTSQVMQRRGSTYSSEIPPQSAATIVQFYVEAVDDLQNTSVFPRGGRDSRALYKVDDGEAADTGLHNMRMVMTPEDTELLHDIVEVMSNDALGLTLIYDESTIFYDANVRLSGSQRARPFQPRLSFKVGFNADQLFRGVHNGITLDRSESTGFGQREHLYHQGMTRSGGLPSEYNDLFNIITPLTIHTGGAEAQFARFSDIFLDEQYANGSEGQVYEYELVYYPTSTQDRSPEGRKLPQPDSVVGAPIRHLGDSNDDYRWTFLNKNNRAQDDYSQFMEFTKVFELTGSAFEEQIGDVIDVDQWLRAFAFSIITGHGDNYGADGSQHNMQMYVRPSDGRVVFFPHDLDAFFTVNRAIIGNADHRKLMRVPQNEHMYYGHVYDMLTNVFNGDYMQHWTDLYGRLLPRQRFDRHLTELVQRTDFLLGQINRVADPTPFSVETELPNIDTSVATLSGKAWFDVREIRIAGSSHALPVEWTDAIDWKVEIPVAKGENTITLQAFDFQGGLLATESITITTTADNPVNEALVISEINYNPYATTQAEQEALPGVDTDSFEFLEFTNKSESPVNLLGLQITSGVGFTFPAVILAAGESTLVVHDQQAFELRYGNNHLIAGEYSTGQLSNSGERIVVADAFGNEAVNLVYGDSDPWPESADGVGTTLELVSPSSTPASQLGKYYAWTSSRRIGGSPGTVTNPNAMPSIVINEIIANSADPTVDTIELFNTTNDAIDIGGWYLSDDSDDLLKFRIPDATVINAGGYAVFTEQQFNPTPANPRPNDFALGSNGDELWLVSVEDDSTVDRLVDNVAFNATDVNQPLGRFPNGTGRLAPLSEATMGTSNSTANIPAIVLSEVNYNPGSPSAAALQIAADTTSDDLEFVELHNRTLNNFDLSTWRLRGAVDIDLDGTTLAAGESIVLVNFSPDNATRAGAFRAHYGIAENVTLVGPYSGQLDNDWELIRLLRSSTDPTNTGRVVAEELIYDDVLPWPIKADGTGSSISRTNLDGFANDGANWTAGVPSPGVAGASGDVNDDGVTDVADVNIVCSALHTRDAEYDLNRDGSFSFNDLEFLLKNVLHTHIGDANVDGTFNSQDFVQVFQAAEYEDAIDGNSTWSEGDWNCDGDFSTADFVVAFQDAGYVAEARATNSRTSDFAARNETANPTPTSNPIGRALAKRIDSVSNQPVELNLNARDLIFESGDFAETDLHDDSENHVALKTDGVDDEADSA